MGDSFMGFGIATSGLYTAQRGLTTVNHNLANVNTAGYSRQVLNQTASRPMMIADGTGMLGTGSEVTSVARVRDDYLDYKYWSENQAKGECEAVSSILDDIEATFNEPSDNGFTKVMDDYYVALQELAKDPGSYSCRALVKENGVSVAKYFNSLAVHFEKIQSDVNTMVKNCVQEINSLAEQIATLNRQIYSFEVDGSIANDLRDERTLAVDKLSSLINIDAYEVNVGTLPSGRDDMRLIVSVSGKPLVDHTDFSLLEVTQRETKLNEEDIENLYNVQWVDGNKLNIKGGELRGLLDVRDGNNGVNGTDPSFRGIPYYQRKMNDFVRVLARTINEGIIDLDGDGTLDDGLGHVDGYRLDANTGDPVSEVRFFTCLDENGDPMDSSSFIGTASTINDIVDQYDQVTAKNFSISAEIDEDYVNNIVSSDVPDQQSNNTIVNAILDMRHNAYMFDEGAPEDFIKTLVATVGVDNQQAKQFSEIQSIITSSIDNKRMSVSGVSIDEEMTLLIKYQNAYTVSAKMINTIAETLDVLINRLGV